MCRFLIVCGVLRRWVNDGREVASRPKAAKTERHRAADADPRSLCAGDDGGANVLQRPELQRSSLRCANAHAVRVCQQQAHTEQGPQEHRFLPPQAAVPSTAAVNSSSVGFLLYSGAFPGFFPRTKARKSSCLSGAFSN